MPTALALPTKTRCSRGRCGRWLSGQVARCAAVFATLVVPGNDEDGIAFGGRIVMGNNIAFTLRTMVTCRQSALPRSDAQPAAGKPSRSKSRPCGSAGSWLEFRLHDPGHEVDAEDGADDAERIGDGVADGGVLFLTTSMAARRPRCWSSTRRSAERGQS